MVNLGKLKDMTLTEYIVAGFLPDTVVRAHGYRISERGDLRFYVERQGGTEWVVAFRADKWSMVCDSKHTDYLEDWLDTKVDEEDYPF